MGQVMVADLGDSSINYLSYSQRFIRPGYNPQMGYGLDGFFVKSIDYGHILGF